MGADELPTDPPPLRRIERERFLDGGVMAEESVGFRLCELLGSGSAALSGVGVEGALPFKPLDGCACAGELWLDVGCERSGLRVFSAAGGDGGGEGGGGGIDVPSVRDECGIERAGS